MAAAGLAESQALLDEGRYDVALATLDKAKAKAMADGELKLQVQVLHAAVAANAAKFDIEEAKAANGEELRVANDFLAKVQSEGDKKGEADAWMLIGDAHAQNAEDPKLMAGDAQAAYEKAFERFLGLGAKDLAAKALGKSAEAYLLLERYQDAQALSKEALSLAAGAGATEPAMAALSVLVAAQSGLGTPGLGVSAAIDELSRCKRANDRAGMAGASKALSEAYLAMGEFQEALLSSKAALEQYREGDDKRALAAMMELTARVQLQKGALIEAKAMAERAGKIYRDEKYKAGEDSAESLLSEIFVGMSDPDNAPHKMPAKQALKELCRAVQEKDLAKYMKAKGKADKYMTMVTPTSFWTAMQPAFDDDLEGAKDFMKEQGFEFIEDSPATVAAVKEVAQADSEEFNNNPASGRSKAGRQYDKTLFYMQMRTMGGIGFGPQFRSVHPYRRGNAGVDATALCPAQLVETEDWELKLGFRPGILDSAVQQTFVSSWS